MDGWNDRTREGSTWADTNKLKSMRDWGKVWNWDEKLGDNRTNYDMYFEGLPYKYYRHYTYFECGWNFKLAEMNAAFGREQLKRLDGFVKDRIHNYEYLHRCLRDVEELKFVSPFRGAHISWFAFPITITNERISRNDLGDHLESKGIRHRPFFAGNITRHPPFLSLKSHYKSSFKTADYLMKNTLFIGCWPGMTTEMLNYIVETIIQYVDSSNT